MNLITRLEVCELLHCGKNLFYKLCKTPSFPVVYVGRNIYVDKDGLEKWIKEQYER